LRHHRQNVGNGQREAELEKADTESAFQKRKEQWQYKILKVIDEVR
jgi:hypothetical protein